MFTLDAQSFAERESNFGFTESIPTPFDDDADDYEVSSSADDDWDDDKLDSSNLEDFQEKRESGARLHYRPRPPPPPPPPIPPQSQSPISQSLPIRERNTKRGANRSANIWPFPSFLHPHGVPFRRIRKSFARYTGMHGFFTPRKRPQSIQTSQFAEDWKDEIE